MQEATVRLDLHGMNCYQAQTAIDAALRRAGRTGQVRVLAHDNSPEIRQFLKEGLVDFSIDQNLPYQSYQALSVLFGAVLEHRNPAQDFFYPSSTILNAETVE